MYKKMNFKLLLLVLPALTFFAIFIIYPLLNAVYTSFFHWNGLTKPIWVGLSNWTQVLGSSGIYHSIYITILVMILSWIAQTPISLALGIFLSQEGKWRTLLSVFYFTPLLFSSAALGIAWSNILNPNFGLIQGIVHNIFHSNMTVNLIGNTHVVIYVLIAIIAWQFIPFHTLLYQSGARAIPKSLYEAAALDGASDREKLWFITIPQMKNTIITSTVIMLTGSLTYFDIIFVLTGGGPGNASMVLALDMYQKAFQEYQIGVGATLAVILAIAGLLLSLALVKWTGFSKMESQMEGA